MVHPLRKSQLNALCSLMNSLMSAAEHDLSVKSSVLRWRCLDFPLKITIMLDSHGGSNDADTLPAAWALCTRCLVYF